jgi:class 3 adenylate cyclase
MDAVDKLLSTDELLALHPWPAKFASEKRLEWMWHIDLPCDSKSTWRLISDTSRLNRALGFAEMHFEDRNGERWGTARNGGVHHEWLEVPWDWVAGQWLTCTRIYKRGFSKVLFAIHHLQPVLSGTRVYFYFGAVARNVTGSLALRLGFPSVQKAYQKLLPAIGKSVGSANVQIFQPPPPELSATAQAKLASARDKLKALSLDPACVDALLDWIATGDELDLYRIQIRERARAWRVDERALLRVALHATRAGVLTLSWDTMCPHCRGRTEEHAQLSELERQAACASCKVEFEVSAAETVEVTFHVHATIRAIGERMFCSAEPATKDHVAVQLMLAPAQRAQVMGPAVSGRYRVATKGIAGCWYLDVDADNAAREIAIGGQKNGDVVAAAPSTTVELANTDEVERLCLIETAAWKDHALGPRHLLSFPDFRDIFAEDFIGTDVRLSVGEQTLLFTDVVGSTAFYEQQGDPQAFVEIKRHFDDVFRLITEHNGAVIKTIGDAVMATFIDPADAVRCSGAIHRRFGPDRPECPIRLRISLNTGPCIAVRLNATMDFFGGTVNVAAKLQSLAETWQVAMSEATYHSAGVREYLETENAALVPLQYVSKSMRGPVAAMRWDVFPSQE